MKPILFNTDMVRAILEGHKTVTRRVVKEKGWKITGRPKWSDEPTWQKDGFFFNVSSDGKKETARTATTHLLRPPYIVGDILWVRETWRKRNGQYEYRADDECPEGWRNMVPWKPSIHMPREAARIFLRVTDVEVKRLRDFGDMPVECEGCVNFIQFLTLWNRTIKPADRAAYGWEANPWVWAIKFERISKEEASK